MQPTLMRSAVFQPNRCGHARCVDMPNATHFVISPRRVAKIVQTARTFTIARAIEEETDPEEVLI
jgi:hypothetical protein